MLRLFNKLLPIVVGILTAALLAACSDALKNGDLIEEGVYWDDDAIYGFKYGPTICDDGYITATGIHSYDETAHSHILTPRLIEGIDVKKLKPFASAPILIPDSILVYMSNIDNESAIKYHSGTMKAQVINGTTYQQVEFVPFNSNMSRSSRTLLIECATRASSEIDQLDYIVSRSSTDAPIFIKVYYHAVRLTNGAGITNKESQASQVITQLERYFSKSKIFFILGGTEYNDCITDWNAHLIKNMGFLFSINSHSDGVDIYELSDCNINEQVAGISQDIPGSAMIIASSSLRMPTTVAHEMGHCLGLYHTHRGSKLSGEDGIEEYADGSNSHNAGDYVTDTPADPNKWNAYGEYSGFYTDSKGTPYNPDPSILMSYSALRNRFTDLQVDRMKAFLDNKVAYLKCGIEISKTSTCHFHNSTTLSVKTPINGFTASWKIKRYASSNFEDQTPTLYETTQTGNNCTLSTTTDDYFEIELTYSYGESSTKDYCSLTANAPSPYTGTLIWETNTGSSGGTTNQAHGESLTIGNNSVTLNLSYLDKAGAILQNLGYRAVTATNRLLEGSSMTVTKADCARGYLKVRMTDACGTWGSYFTIPVTIIGGYYAMNVDTASGRITLSSEAGASPSGKTAVKAKAPAIGTIIIYDSTGKTVATLNGNAASTANISTTGWPKGEYRAEVSDGAGYNQTILFAL